MAGGVAGTRMPIQTLDDLAVQGTTLGVRIDINSPLTDSGSLADDARLMAHVDTLSELLERDGKVAILAHQGRPGSDDFASLSAHAERLNELLPYPISHCDGTFSAEARRAVENLREGEAVVLENTRFYSEEYMEFPAEKAANTHLVDRLSPVLDAYINDAFAAAHRSQPSLVGFPTRLPGYAGRVMEREVDVLGDIEGTPRSRTYVVGGAKVSDSIAVARNVLERDLADHILTVGVVGNVFLFADGADLGDASADFIHEQGYWDYIDDAAELLEAYGDRIHLPEDTAVERDGERVELTREEFPPKEDEAAMDIGGETMAAYSEILRESGTVILNGPAGVFEDETFANGTRELYAEAANAEFSIIGGGDTAAAIRKFDLDGFDHVSTGGGACLRMLTGEPLPALQALSR